MLYAVAGDIYVAFESEAVFNSFKQLEHGVAEVRDWVVQAQQQDGITYASVTQEWLDAMDEDNCKRNADGTWTVALGLDGWFAQDVWEQICDGVQDEDEDED